MRYLRILPAASLVASFASCTSLLGDFGNDNGPGGGDGGTQTDSSLDGTAGDAGDSGASESGSGDGSGGEAGGGEGGGQDGGTPFSCTLVSAQQRVVSGGDGGTISADGLVVYGASQTNVLALVKTGSPPGLAYEFRSDHPGDAPQVVQLQSTTGVPTPARLVSATRSVDNAHTFVLGSDQNNNFLLWEWSDSSGIGAPPVATAAETVQYATTTMIAAQTGLFFASAVQNQGVFLDYEMPPNVPSFVPGNGISTTVDTGLTDGQRAYRLSDGSVSLLYYGSDMTLHQNIYAPGGLTLSSTRQFFAGQMLPLSFQADGTNVDIAVVEPTNDAGTAYGIFVGVVPEAQLGTFNPATALKPLSSMLAVAGSNGCVAPFPGGLLALLPTTSGMDLFVIDPATASVRYSLTGATNILHGDTEIVACGVGVAPSAGNALDFNVIWTDNAGGGAQNLLYVPLQCTP